MLCSWRLFLSSWWPIDDIKCSWPKCSVQVFDHSHHHAEILLVSMRSCCWRTELPSCCDLSIHRSSAVLQVGSLTKSLAADGEETGTVLPSSAFLPTLSVLCHYSQSRGTWWPRRVNNCCKPALFPSNSPAGCRTVNLKMWNREPTSPSHEVMFWPSLLMERKK